MADAATRTPGALPVRPTGRAGRRWRWLLPLCVAGFAAVAYLTLNLLDAYGGVWYWLGAATLSLAGLVLLSAWRAHLWSVSASIVLLWLVPRTLSGVPCDDLRARLRWTLGSETLKAQVLAQRRSPYGGMQHMEWDGWGFAGAPPVYLIFDPENVLERPALEHTPGAVLTPSPCGVPRVQRLERSWYSVVFYTDETWENHH